VEVVEGTEQLYTQLDGLPLKLAVQDADTKVADAVIEERRRFLRMLDCFEDSQED